MKDFFKPNIEMNFKQKGANTPQSGNKDSMIPILALENPISFINKIK